MATYRNACYNCHGDSEQPGSIPNSRQFRQEAFRNGADAAAEFQKIIDHRTIVASDPVGALARCNSVVRTRSPGTRRTHEPRTATSFGCGATRMSTWRF